MESFADLVGGAQRTQCVVLMGDRDAEQRDEGVADDLLERAAVALENGARLLEVATDDGAHDLRIDRLPEARRADHVREEDRHRLALRHPRESTNRACPPSLPGIGDAA
jgi:hypothetical protein